MPIYTYVCIVEHHAYINIFCWCPSQAIGLCCQDLETIRICCLMALLLVYCMRLHGATDSPKLGLVYTLMKDHNSLNIEPTYQRECCSHFCSTYIFDMQMKYHISSESDVCIVTICMLIAT